MARRTARPEATYEKTLIPLQEHCEQCGQLLWVAHHSHRTVFTLSGLWRLTLVVRQCVQPGCPRFHQPYRPEEEGAASRCPTASLAVPGDGADWEVSLPGTSQCAVDASGASGTWHSYCAAQCHLFDAAL